MARDTMTQDSFGDDLTIGEMARTWLAQMTAEEREEIRTGGAAGWRGGISAAEVAMTEEQIGEMIEEMERQVAAAGAPRWSEGDRVEAGDTAADYDTGRVHDVDGDRVLVAWDSGVQTRHDAAELHAEGSREGQRLFISDARIEALREEAAAAGDYAQTRLCDLALTGDARARAECVRVMGDARAME